MEVFMRWIVLLLAATLSGGCTAQPSPERLMDATVTLYREAGATPDTLLCTGVAVSPHVVLTAKHCVEDGLPWFEGFKDPEDTLIGDDGTDNVLVWTKHKWKHYLRMAHYTPQVGQDVQVLGHPAGLPMSYRKGYVVGKWIEQTFAQYMFSKKYVFSFMGAGGDSGGPIMDMDGRILCTVSHGLLHSAYPHFSFIGCYPPKFTKEQLKWLKSPSPPTKSSNS